MIKEPLQVVGTFQDEVRFSILEIGQAPPIEASRCADFLYIQSGIKLNNPEQVRFLQLILPDGQKLEIHHRSSLETFVTLVHTAIDVLGTNRMTSSYLGDCRIIICNSDI